MSKTSVALLIILTVFIASFFFVSFSLPFSLPQLAQTKLPLLPSTAETKTTIAFATTEQLVRNGQQETIGLTIDAPTQLAVAQVEISYDPLLLTIVDVTPGDYFLNPIELIKVINPANGRLSYALTCSAPTGETCINSQAKHLATIRYIPRTTSTQKTTLTIMPKTLVQIDKITQQVNRGKAVTIQIVGNAPRNASQSATVEQTVPLN